MDAASATAEDLTVSIVSSTGAVYNTVLFAQDMDTVQDLVWQPTRPIDIPRGDGINVAWLNTNGRVFGLEIIWTALGV